MYIQWQWLYKNKRFYQGLFLFFALFFFAFYTISYATEDRHQIKAAHEAPLQNGVVEDIQKLVQKYEEAKWIQEDQALLSKNEIKFEWSKSFFDKKPNLDRLKMMLQVNELFLGGAYEDFLEFVHLQPKVVRLNFSEFQRLKNQINMVITDIHHLTRNQVKEVIELAIVIREVAKTKAICNKAAIYEIFEDHEQNLINSILQKHPEIFPSYAKFTRNQQELLKQVTSPIAFEDVFFLQDGAKEFAKLYEMDELCKNRSALDIALYVFMCSYAGQSEAQGKGVSSAFFTSSAYKQMIALSKASHLLFKKGATKAYHRYLSSCTNQLGLDVRSPLNQALTKIAVLAEISNEEAGKILKEAFLKLPPEDLKVIIDWFSEGEHDREKLQGFSSILRASLQSEKMGANFRERVNHTVSTTLSVVADSLKKWEDLAKRQKSKRNSVLDFEDLIPICIQDPTVLKERSVTVTPEGKVFIADFTP